MKLAHALSFAFVATILVAPAWAAQDDSHHPTAATTVPASKGMPSKPSLQIALMDTQLKAMGDVHDKLMAAKTPEERNALMPEHMQAMQDAATMMNGMTARGMAGKKGDMAAHHRMMDKRMEMMQATMLLMMDRLPATTAK